MTLERIYGFRLNAQRKVLPMVRFVRHPLARRDGRDDSCANSKPFRRQV